MSEISEAAATLELVAKLKGRVEALEEIGKKCLRMAKDQAGMKRYAEARVATDIAEWSAGTAMATIGRMKQLAEGMS